MIPLPYQVKGGVIKIDPIEGGSDHEDEVEIEADEFSEGSCRKPGDDLVLRNQIDDAVSFNKRLELMNIRVLRDSIHHHQ